MSTMRYILDHLGRRLVDHLGRRIVISVYVPPPIHAATTVVVESASGTMLQIESPSRTTLVVETAVGTMLTIVTSENTS